MAEAEDDDEDDEELKGEELKRVEQIEEAALRQRLEHEEENREMFRNWCAVCIAGRGIGGRRRRKRKKRAADLSEGPLICSDFSTCQQMNLEACRWW